MDKKLKKEYEIIVPYILVETKINDSAVEIRKTLNLKGFRKGQVPLEVIKQKYGKSLMVEESDKIVSEEIKKIVKDKNLKIAMQPKVDLKIFEEGKDLQIAASFEIFPEIPEVNLDKIKIEKREIEITPSDVDEGIDKLLKFYRKFDKQAGDYKAKIGDTVNIDYVGKIDKEEFTGGSAKNHQLELGSKSFIDDFEEQLVGAKKGDEIKVKVKFPKEYHNEKFSGKKAEFDVKINEVLSPQKLEINDELIKNNFGLENKTKLEEEIKKQISGNYQALSRDMFKKELFDFLNKKYDFDLPNGLVEEQLTGLWKEVEDEISANPEKFKNEKEKEKAKNEKRKIAERMIRCGIILNDLATKNKVEVTNDDINKELGKVLQKFAGQEKTIIDYYQKNPNAISQLKGSIIEEKTVDFIIEKANIEKKQISMKDFDKLWKKISEG